MSVHRQNYTPRRARQNPGLSIGLAIVIGIALTQLALHWSLQ